MSDLVYLNGEMVESGEARISAFDGGLTHGAGLFETIRVYNGNAFQLDEHLRRLRVSAAKLHVPIPVDDAELTRAVARVLLANELRDARMRLTVTTGDARAPGAEEGEPHTATILIAAQKFEAYPADYYRRGMTVCVSSFKQGRHDPTVGHKTVSYLPRLLALREANAKQCGEALWFTTDNRLAEGCVSNAFLVRDEKLYTPPLDTPVLPGIARNVVLRCAAAKRIASHEQPLTIDDLLAADEVFLTNVVMEIMPVCRIERHAVGDEKVGELTRTLRDAYGEVVRKECRIGA
jgi:branched-chain amino acid aminotransferase